MGQWQHSEKRKAELYTQLEYLDKKLYRLEDDSRRFSDEAFEATYQDVLADFERLRAEWNACRVALARRNGVIT